ncbi:MAG: hypothetical protein GWP03_03670 [Proteobacteria bacterium]|nr:hypothetical protein [Pseudomonadota bacterium]
MKKKVIVMFSGGVDSILVYKIVEKWGFNPIAITFTSPFIKRLDRKYYIDRYNIELKEIDFTKDQFEAVKSPVYGYGKAINPCIDCHAAMIRMAREMDKEGALFIATGEVVGQRPMSQRKDAMNSVDKLSGARGYIVRPLSGGLLQQTIPEKKGTIKREWLYKITGRGRKKQYELCKELGIGDIPSSGGGCLLTETSFMGRVKTVMKYGEEGALGYIKYGRMFDLKGAILILARNKEESDYIEENGGKNVIVPQNMKGPTGILFGEEKESKACEIIGMYSKGEEKCIECGHRGKIIKAKVYDEKNIDNLVV